MEPKVEITSIYHPHDDLHDLCVKEGGREAKVLSLMKGGTIEFCYYNLRAWEYPFHLEPLTEAVAPV